MTARRQLSEQSRRYNAVIADAVMRAEAEGRRVVPSDAKDTSHCMCPLGAVVRGFPCYPYAGTVGEDGRIDVDWAFSFIRGFDCGDSTMEAFSEAYYLGRLYRARALRMHGGDK